MAVLQRGRTSQTPHKRTLPRNLGKKVNYAESSDDESFVPPDKEEEPSGEPSTTDLLPEFEKEKDDGDYDSSDDDDDDESECGTEDVEIDFECNDLSKFSQMAMKYFVEENPKKKMLNTMNASLYFVAKSCKKDIKKVKVHAKCEEVIGRWDGSMPHDSHELLRSEESNRKSKGKATRKYFLRLEKYIATDCKKYFKQEHKIYVKSCGGGKIALAERSCDKAFHKMKKFLVYYRKLTLFLKLSMPKETTWEEIDKLVIKTFGTCRTEKQVQNAIVRTVKQMHQKHYPEFWEKPAAADGDKSDEEDEDDKKEDSEESGTSTGTGGTTGTGTATATTCTGVGTSAAATSSVGGLGVGGTTGTGTATATTGTATTSTSTAATGTGGGLGVGGSTATTGTATTGTSTAATGTGTGTATATTGTSTAATSSTGGGLGTGTASGTSTGTATATTGTAATGTTGTDVLAATIGKIWPGRDTYFTRKTIEGPPLLNDEDEYTDCDTEWARKQTLVLQAVGSFVDMLAMDDELSKDLPFLFA